VRTPRPTSHHEATRRLLSAASLPLGALGLILWFIAVRRSEFSHIGELGLVTVLGWTFFTGLVLLVSGLSLELVRTPMRPHRLMVLVIGLVIMLFGTASAVEPTARVVDSWVHAGFVQYIFVHGHVLNSYDARFSWPGGFSLGALLVGFTGQTNALDFLRWAPLVFELLYLPPLLVIAKCSGVGRRAGWLGVTLFYAANWTDQDYFSPQALNLFFFLVVVATVLAAWKPKGLSQPGGHDAGLRARMAQIRAGFTLRRMGGHDTVATWNGTLTIGVLGCFSWSAWHPPSAIRSHRTHRCWRWPAASSPVVSAGPSWSSSQHLWQWVGSAWGPVTSGWAISPRSSVRWGKSAARSGRT